MNDIELLNRNFRWALTDRTDALCGDACSGHAYTQNYLLNVLYHMTSENEWAAEYLKRELTSLRELNELEGIAAIKEIAVPAESL